MEKITLGEYERLQLAIERARQRIALISLPNKDSQELKEAKRDIKESLDNLEWSLISSFSVIVQDDKDDRVRRFERKKL